MSKLEEVRVMMMRNPKIKPRHISKRMGIAVNYVYVLMTKVRKQFLEKHGCTFDSTAGLAIREAENPTKKYRMLHVSTSDNSIEKVMEKELSIDMVESKPDPVNHPEHYKVGGVETIDFIEAKKLDYNLGNVVKYITRADHKGAKLQDLQKAQWYLNRAVQSLSA